MKVKKILTFRGVLNIYGILTILGWILTIYTHPITVDQENGIFFNQSLMLSDEKMKELLSFLFVVGVIYFSIVNMYCNKRNKRDKA